MSDVLTVLLSGTAVVLALLAVAFLVGSPRSPVLFAAILSAPVFLKLTGSSITLGDRIVPTGTGQTFPVGVLAVMLVGWLLCLRILVAGRWTASAANGPIVALIGINLIALLVGLVFDDRLQGVLFFLQTVGPMLCFYIGLNTVDSVDSARRVAKAVVYTVGAFAVSLITFTAHAMLTGAAATTAHGVFTYASIVPVYTLLDYVPIVVSLAYGLGLALLLSRVERGWRGLVLTGVVVSLLGAIFLLHSKGALLTAMVMTAVQIALFGRFEWAKGRTVAATATIGVAVWLLLTVPGLPTSRSIGDFVESLTQDQSFRTRELSFASAVEIIANNPFVGSAYVPRLEERSGSRRIAYPHNQYLSYAVRAGLAALVAYLWVLFGVHRRLLALGRRAETVELQGLATGLLSVLFGVSLISNMLQENFVQTYSGCVLWFLIGVGEALVAKKQKAADQTNAVWDLRPLVVG